MFDRDKFRVLFYKTGLTQAEFGYLVGTTAGSVSHWLHNVNKPKEGTIEKIAKALHCNVSDLMTWGGASSEIEKPTEITNEEKDKETLAFESIETAIELIKIARDMLKEIRKGATK